MDRLISQQAAIELAKDVCDAIMSGCKSHYDSEVGDEVYDDILEVDAILKCNKEIRKALKAMPSAQPQRKSVNYYGDGYSNGQMVYDSAECPSCGYIFDENDNIWGEPYCPHCGQALDWYM